MRRYLAALLFLLGHLAFPAAAAQGARADAAMPTEVMLLDPTGFTMLGYGTMDGNLLRLEVLVEVGEFVLLLIAPSGALEWFDGSQGVDGSLRLEDADGGGAQLLELFFASRNIELMVVRRSQVPGEGGATETSDVDDSDDGSDRPGEEAESDDDGDDEDDDDSDDDRGDDEDDDDEDDDEDDDDEDDDEDDD